MTLRDALLTYRKKNSIEKIFNSSEGKIEIEIFTDGNNDYTHILPDYYANTCINYGQIIKIREKCRVTDKKKSERIGRFER